MEYALEIKSLTKEYKKKIILDNIDLKLNIGDIVGLVGNNGVGKTTLMKCILDLVSSEEGNITIDGQSNKHPASFKSLGASLENPKLMENLTGYDNLLAISYLYSNVTKRNIEQTIQDLKMKHYIKKKVKTYSLGMKQKLSLAMTCLNNPSFLILDEPFNGLDPQNTKLLKNYIRRNSKEKTILISSHHLSDLENFCDSFFILEDSTLKKIDLVSNKDLYELEMSYITEEILDEILKNSNLYKTYTFLDDHNKILIHIGRNNIPKLIRLLQSQNVDIYSIIPRNVSLESAILSRSEVTT